MMACGSLARRESSQNRSTSWGGWRVVLMLSTALLAGVSCRSSGEPQALELDLQPFTDPVATWARLEASGEARVVRYSASAFVVTAVYEGRLSDDRTQRLLASAGKAARGRAERGGRASSGLEHGDLFSLKVSSAGSTRRIDGFRHLAEAETEALIAELTGLDGEMEEIAAPEAFLRVEELSAQQAEALRKRGLIRPLPIRELPAPLRTRVEEVLPTAASFQPVDAATCSQVVALANHGKELLVEFAGTVFKLSPFEARNVSVLFS